VRNPSYIAIACGLLLAFSGCGQSNKVAAPKEGSANYNDWRYYQSLLGLDPARTYGDFLKSLDPGERVKYINKSIEEGQSTTYYAYKAAYEQFANDPSPDVAAAAKDALSKVPSKEEYESLKKEEIEAQKK
jgi:hypothetical protein